MIDEATDIVAFVEIEAHAYRIPFSQQSCEVLNLKRE